MHTRRLYRTPQHGLIRRGVSLVAAFLVAALAGAATLQSVQAASNGVWAITSPAEFGGGSEPINLDISAGELQQTYVDLENLTRDQITITLTAGQGQRTEQVAATRPTADGEEVPSPNTANWLTLAAGNLQVPAQGKQRIAVDVRVPPGTASGDYIAAVLGTSQGTFNPLTQTQNLLGQQILVYLRVQGPLTDKLTASSIRVNGSQVLFSIANDGNTRLNPTATLTALGAEGNPIDIPPRPVGLMEPGTDVALGVDLAEPPSSLMVSVTSDAPTVEQQWPQEPIGAVVVQPGELLPGIPNEGDDSAVIVVWAVIAASAVVLLLWASSRRRKARRRKSAALAANAAPPHVKADGDPSPPSVPPAPPPGFAQAMTPLPVLNPPGTGSVITGTGRHSVIAPR